MKSGDAPSSMLTSTSTLPAPAKPHGAHQHIMIFHPTPHSALVEITLFNATRRLAFSNESIGFRLRALHCAGPEILDSLEQDGRKTRSDTMRAPFISQVFAVSPGSNFSHDLPIKGEYLRASMNSNPPNVKLGSFPRKALVTT